jgi:hypothetical protein
MQLQVSAESELVLRLFSDIMPCSVVGENIIKIHHGDNLKTLTSLRRFIENFSWNTIVFAEMHNNPLHSYEINEPKTVTPLYLL